MPENMHSASSETGMPIPAAIKAKKYTYWGVVEALAIRLGSWRMAGIGRAESEVEEVGIL